MCGTEVAQLLKHLTSKVELLQKSQDNLIERVQMLEDEKCKKNKDIKDVSTVAADLLEHVRSTVDSFAPEYKFTRSSSVSSETAGAIDIAVNRRGNYRERAPSSGMGSFNRSFEFIPEESASISSSMASRGNSVSKEQNLLNFLWTMEELVTQIRGLLEEK